MAISLQKGGNLSLTKTDSSLDEVIVGLGWDARASDGADFDLDASAFLLAPNGRVRGDMDFASIIRRSSEMVPLNIKVII